MSAKPLTNLDQLCIMSVTTKQWDIHTAIDKYAAAGVKGITLWRNNFEKTSPAEVKKHIADAGLKTVSLCRGGFFPALDAAKRQAAIDDNKRAVDEAAGVGAPIIVLVCGAVPGLPLTEARKHVLDGMNAVLPYAAQAGVKLSIEPLHPMYAADRSCVSDLKTANDLCQATGAKNVGVALDVFHVWWDPMLPQEIVRCAKNGWLDAFHICDWKPDMNDMLNDRGLMGEGCIDIRALRAQVEAVGFHGFHEVEVFSTVHWARDPDEYLADIVKAYRAHS